MFILDSRVYGPNDDIFTELWIGVKQYGNESLFYDTGSEIVGDWKPKIPSSQDPIEKGSSLRGITNKTVRR